MVASWAMVGTAIAAQEAVEVVAVRAAVAMVAVAAEAVVVVAAEVAEAAVTELEAAVLAAKAGVWVSVPGVLVAAFLGAAWPVAAWLERCSSAGTRSLGCRGRTPLES